MSSKPKPATKEDSVKALSEQDRLGLIDHVRTKYPFATIKETNNLMRLELKDYQQGKSTAR